MEPARQICRSGSIPGDHGQESRFPQIIALGVVRSGRRLLPVLARHALAVVPLVLLLGIAGFVLNPAIYGRVFAIASQAPTLAEATTASAFQLGISLVPALAGAALSAGAGITSVAWIGACLAAAVVPTVLLDRTISRRRSQMTVDEAGSTG